MISKTLGWFILISTAFIDASIIRHVKTNDICEMTRSILCVEGTLMSIAKAAKNIAQTAHKIEQDILRKNTDSNTLNDLVEAGIDSIRADLPTSEYHLNFSKMKKVDQKYLGYLMIEAHNAMSFYYNSIDELFKLDKKFKLSTDSGFRAMQLSLTSDMICRYRSVLAVYSLPWQPINQIRRISALQASYPYAQPIISDNYSLVILKLLREWMLSIHSVIDNLNGKFE